MKPQEKIKRVFTIRVGGKERKRKVRTLLLDLAHFRNILTILITKYYTLYKEHLLNQSILYGLVAKNYTGKYKEEFEKVLKNIENNPELADLLIKLKNQKEKVDNPHYIQYIIRQTIKDFKNFFKSLESFKTNPEKFKEIPRPPKAKKLKYLINFSVEGNVNTFKQEGDKIIIRLKNNKYLKVKLPKDFPYKISSLRIKLFGDDLYVDAVYEQEVELKNPVGEYKAGIDIGLDEMISVVSENVELKSFIVSGKEIKAFNQWFNKEMSKLRAEINNLKNSVKRGFIENQVATKKIYELELKMKSLSSHRKRWLDNNFHKIARKLVDLLHETGHKTIYIGKNAIESKNGIDLGKKTNQEFVSIPFRRLIKLIEYKAYEYGMEVIEVDESYTSKTSPLANIFEVKETKNKEVCQGKRDGDIFKDKVLNKVFHADLVGAVNIIRVGAKLLRLRFYENLKTFFIKLCNPVKLKLIDLFYKVSPESLRIGSSRWGASFPAGWMEKSGYLNTFGT
ncbi:putative transposase ORF_B [Sulfurihydrogenibium azorense Az-Fu1]|uniref:Putative transposase ORF_B n=1 Tax=Sulfurihydrogenibium azorense (strain DSM 15241 / OCM 825 / Az-Fu1) TaxID=204536 RepID=C1DXH6_SULAA|nr:RNA-guided endonuclease TnpB family protein [Sulfurihydrogenibium azorense]ACN98326.1 putative transposase ORF_B [Sulfurihydrogenibium azorense Az-Fu1]